MRILLAPDKFKGSLTAAQVAAALAAGLRQARPDVEIDNCPIADGGEGTVAAALAAGFRRSSVTVNGPTGQPVPASYAMRADAAVVEMASASGLQLLPGGRPAPLTATSFGTGQLLASALDAGARTIVLGIGGSACTDGGAGMITALGARLADRLGVPLDLGGAALTRLTRLDLAGLHHALGGNHDTSTRIVVASDVTNPLLGPHGAAAVYGPQKGASNVDVALLEAALTHWGDIVEATTGTRCHDQPGAGAAGGAGFAALALLGATMRSGIEVMLELLDFRAKLERADFVITGEGSLDQQTLHGKGPAGVAAAAHRQHIPVIAVAGQVTLEPAQLTQAGFARAYALTDLEPQLERSIAHARELLANVGRQIGTNLRSPQR